MLVHQRPSAEVGHEFCPLIDCHCSFEILYTDNRTVSSYLLKIITIQAARPGPVSNLARRAPRAERCHTSFFLPSSRGGVARAGRSHALAARTRGPAADSRGDAPAHVLGFESAGAAGAAGLERPTVLKGRVPPIALLAWSGT